MKNKIITLLIILLCIVKVDASKGMIRQDSIIECNGKYYGSHGNPLHYHEVKKENDVWVSIGKEVVPPCKIEKENIKEKVFFSKCMDGDTAKFIINNEEQTVRFLAINAPEVEHKDQDIKEEPFGKEASDYTCNLLKNAKEIVLEYDTNSDRQDKYGRILAFVYVDNELIEEKLINKGYAKVAYVYDNYAYVEKLKELEEKAKDKKVGIWSEIILPDVQDEKEEENEFIKVVNNVIEFLTKIIEKIFALF